MIKLTQFCREQKISYSTGIRWFKQGRIPGAYQNPQTKSIFVDENSAENKESFFHSLENDIRYFLEILKLDKNKIEKIIKIVKE